ncbi:Transcriptional regulatory protein uhpA [Ewingella americana]|uniref:Transcriptional regulatory protein uhpA n=1 Tax=Ewingella americana TaxID=41202 RepID=A0A377NBW0_9GAMM|nr:Transcriptional regulatory protein uhpA [Ewingella americana]
MLADDHVLMREGLKQIFNLDKQLTVVAEAGNGEEVLTALAQTECDILLLDLSMARHQRNRDGAQNCQRVAAPAGAGLEHV